MRVLLTGSAGFAGSHFVDHILENTDWEIIGFESFAHRGDSLRVRHDARYQIHTLDLAAPISDRLLESIKPIDIIVNMASESHVDRSISDPVPFVQNNVSLALNVLEAARKLRPKYFHQISTDEVYGPALANHKHPEWSATVPSNPYSASKAAQEAIAISYWRTYQVPVVISNTMNLIGERQDKEKFVPLCISKILRGEKVTIHGNDEYIGTRHYLHARNHADALLFITKNTEPLIYSDSRPEYILPNRFNIVGELEINNLQLAQMIADIIGKPLKYKLVDFHGITTRPGHDRRYALDGSLMETLGWKAPVAFYPSLENTVKWYLDNQNWL